MESEDKLSKALRFLIISVNKSSSNGQKLGPVAVH
jgi:hypothetical protein